MAEAAVAAENTSGGTDGAPDTVSRSVSGRGRCGRRSDGGLATVGFLGDFARGHALFSLYRLGPDQSRYPNGPCEYLVDCDDGVGPHEVCRFSVDESERGGSGLGGIDVAWRGAWKGDRWGGWIMRRVRDLLAASGGN
jgi:hypothetical protein